MDKPNTPAEVDGVTVQPGVEDGVTVQPEVDGVPSRVARLNKLNQLVRAYVILAVLLSGTALTFATILPIPVAEWALRQWGQVAFGTLTTIGLAAFFLLAWPQSSTWLSVMGKSSVPSLAAVVRIFASLISPFPVGRIRTFENIIEEASVKVDAKSSSSHRPLSLTLHRPTTLSASVVAAESSLQTSTPESPRDALQDIPDIISKSVEDSRKRLLRALDKLEQKSNRNLIFGLVVATLGLAVIGHAVFAASSFYDINISREIAIAHTVLITLPKFLLGVILEIVSMFFLRLYRQGLDDFKYYHNELTNIESRWLALYSAYKLSPACEKDTAMNSVIAQLAITERNFILKSGESTVVLERERILGQLDRRPYDTITTVGRSAIDNSKE
ncbi:MAG: hypothetical protein R6X02_21350 [Enhygromyxa sp.]